MKTISIRDFTNQADLIYAPLEYKFNETLRNAYIRQTKLRFIPQNGDLHLEGEIVGYDVSSLGVRDNNFAATSKLTMTVRVRYTNNTNHNEDFEQTFSTSETFDSSVMLSSVESDLTDKMTKDLVDMIFNATVANW
ncbi:MAG: LPS assembly lipoprotein LptE [Candidatus Azobacteroides sp.]|nr:LPS assembly lipoprotein LptE [Candidatus Azobacteroides sp.]